VTGNIGHAEAHMAVIDGAIIDEIAGDTWKGKGGA
jgi:hypothetical protein